MALNTPHNVTLTEGQIGVILCSLEYYTDMKDLDYGDPVNDDISNIFNILEGSVDKYYDKIEKARAKRPEEEW